MLARRHSEDAASNPCRELAYFVTTGIVISAFALPIVLARAEVTVSPTTPAPDTVTTTISPTTTVITGGACGFVLTANAIMFLTILGFFITFDG